MSVGLFILGYAIPSLWSQKLAEKLNRKFLLGISCIGLGASSLATSEIDSFELFCLMRFTLGVFITLQYAATSSLIVDYFPLKYRSTANAIDISAIYFGTCFASANILILNKIGWK